MAPKKKLFFFSVDKKKIRLKPQKISYKEVKSLAKK